MTAGTFSGGGLGFGVAFSLKDRFSAVSQKIQGSMSKLDASTTRMQQRVNASIGKMTSGLKMMGVGALLSAPFIMGVSKSMEFNKQMSSVYAKSRVENIKLRDELKATALELGKSTKFTATESAEAMDFLAMAGFKVNDSINEIADAMPGLLDLASAGNTDLAVTADIVSDSLTAMGMKASETGILADQMAATVTRANTGILQMGESLKYSSATAKSVGMSFAELSAVIGMVGDIGIKGSMAGTATARMLSKMGKLAENTSILNKLGLNKSAIVDGQGNFKKWTEILPTLGDAVSKYSAKYGNQAALMLKEKAFGKQGMRAFAAFEKGFTDKGDVKKDFASFTKVVEEDLGASKRIAEEMLNNLSGDFTKLSSIWDTTLIGLGDSVEGALRPVVQIITMIVEGFDKFAQSKVGSFVMSLVAGFGALLLVMGLVKLITGGVSWAFAKLTPEIIKSYTAMLPWIAIGLAIVGVIILIKRSIKEFNSKTADELGKSGGLIGMLEKIGGLFMGIKEMFSNGFTIFAKDGSVVEDNVAQLSPAIEAKLKKIGLLDTVKNIGTWIVRIRKFFISMGETLSKVWFKVKLVFSKIGDFFQPLLDKFDNFGISIGKNKSDIEKWGKAGEYVAYALAVAFGILAVNTLIAFAPVILTIAAIGLAIYGVIKLVDWIKTSFPETWSAMGDAVKGVWEYIKKLASILWDLTKISFGFLVDIWDAFMLLFETGDFGGFMEDIFNAFGNFANNMLDYVGNFVSQLWDKFAEMIGITGIWKDFADGIFGTIWSTFRGVIDAFISFGSTIFGAIGDLFSGIWDAFSDFFNGGSWGDLFSDLFSVFFDYFSTIVTAVWQLIKDLWSVIINYFAGIGSAIWGLMSSIWGMFVSWLSKLWNRFKNWLSNMWQGVKDWASGLIDDFTALWENLASVFTFDNIWNFFIDSMSKVYDFGVNFVEMLKQGIADAWGALTDWLGNKWDELTASFKGFFGMDEETSNVSNPVNNKTSTGVGVTGNLIANQKANAVVPSPYVFHTNTNTQEVASINIQVDGTPLSKKFIRKQKVDNKRNGGF